MNATCDKCNKEFEVIMQIDNLPNGVEKNYFTCQHCNTEYIAFCTDDEVRKKQDDMKVLYYNLRMTRNTKKYNNILENIKKLEASIKEDMNHLKQNLIKDGE